jgi:4-phytase/acid phosphatase
MEMAPGGSLEKEVEACRTELALLQSVLLCCSQARCERNGRDPGCTLTDIPSRLAQSVRDRPDLSGPLEIGSTASQTFLLQYLEGFPMSQVGWGRLTRPQIETLLRFHPVKFKYENGPAYVARVAARPLVERICGALAGQAGDATVTLLAGHDTNLADVGSLLGLDWQAESYPRGDVPPGGALGFESLSDAAGKRYVRVFFRAQTMDQLRNLVLLEGAQQPYRAYLAIPGCSETGESTTPCPLEQFMSFVDSRLNVAGDGARR